TCPAIPLCSASAFSFFSSCHVYRSRRRGAEPGSQPRGDSQSRSVSIRPQAHLVHETVDLVTRVVDLNSNARVTESISERVSLVAQRIEPCHHEVCGGNPAHVGLTRWRYQGMLEIVWCI